MKRLLILFVIGIALLVLFCTKDYKGSFIELGKEIDATESSIKTKKKRLGEITAKINELIKLKKQDEIKKLEREQKNIRKEINTLEKEKKEKLDEYAYNFAMYIKKLIDKGESFSELAKKYSEDYGSAKKGGDLGYFTHGVMVKEFEKKAFDMDVGEISEPVKSRFGYHIIKVEGITNINKSNIYKILGANARRAIMKINRLKGDKYLENVMKSVKINADLLSDVDRIVGGKVKDDEVVASISTNYKLTWKEFRDKYYNRYFAGLYHSMKNNKSKNKENNIKRVIDFLKRRVLQWEALYYDAIKKGMKNTRYYKSNTDKRNYDIKNIIIRELENKIKNEARGYNPSENEIKEWYRKNKKNYIGTVSRKLANGKTVSTKSLLPLNQVKNRIIGEIRAKKVDDSMKEFEKKLLKDNGFKIVNTGHLKSVKKVNRKRLDAINKRLKEIRDKVAKAKGKKKEALKKRLKQIEKKRDKINAEFNKKWGKFVEAVNKTMATYSNSDKVIAKTKNKNFTLSDLAKYINIAKGGARNDILTSKKKQKEVIKEMVMRELKYSEALKRNIDKEANVKEQIKRKEMGDLIRALWKTQIEDTPINEKAVRARHILIRPSRKKKYEVEAVVKPKKKQ